MVKILKLSRTTHAKLKYLKYVTRAKTLDQIVEMLCDAELELRDHDAKKIVEMVLSGIEWRMILSTSETNRVWRIRERLKKDRRKQEARDEIRAMRRTPSESVGGSID